MLTGRRGRITRELQLRCRKPSMLLVTGRDAGCDVDVVSKDVSISMTVEKKGPGGRSERCNRIMRHEVDS